MEQFKKTKPCILQRFKEQVMRHGTENGVVKLKSSPQKSCGVQIMYSILKGNFERLCFKELLGGHETSMRLERVLQELETR